MTVNPQLLPLPNTWIYLLSSRRRWYTVLTVNSGPSDETRTYLKKKFKWIYLPGHPSFNLHFVYLRSLTLNTIKSWRSLKKTLSIPSVNITSALYWTWCRQELVSRHWITSKITWVIKGFQVDENLIHWNSWLRYKFIKIIESLRLWLTKYEGYYRNITLGERVSSYNTMMPHIMNGFLRLKISSTLHSSE